MILLMSSRTDRRRREFRRARHRPALAHRGDQHHHRRRQAGVPHLRRPGRVRARCHPRADARPLAVMVCVAPAPEGDDRAAGSRFPYPVRDMFSTELPRELIPLPRRLSRQIAMPSSLQSFPRKGTGTTKRMCFISCARLGRRLGKRLNRATFGRGRSHKITSASLPGRRTKATGSRSGEDHAPGHARAFRPAARAQPSLRRGLPGALRGPRIPRQQRAGGAG